jgi:hypothetical protein
MKLLAHDLNKYVPRPAVVIMVDDNWSEWLFVRRRPWE